MIPLTVVCVALVALLAYRECLTRLERRELYTRIQSPQLAPMLAPLPSQVDGGPSYVPFDDDDAFHDAEREALNGNN